SETFASLANILRVMPRRLRSSRTRVPRKPRNWRSGIGSRFRARTAFGLITLAMGGFRWDLQYNTCGRHGVKNREAHRLAGFRDDLLLHSPYVADKEIHSIASPGLPFPLEAVGRAAGRTPSGVCSILPVPVVFRFWLVQGILAVFVGGSAK